MRTRTVIATLLSTPAIAAAIGLATAGSATAAPAVPAQSTAQHMLPGYTPVFCPLGTNNDGGCTGSGVYNQFTRGAAVGGTTGAIGGCITGAIAAGAGCGPAAGIGAGVGVITGGVGGVLNGLH